jgi:outer membrane protein assembly factor BamC
MTNSRVFRMLSPKSNAAAALRAFAVPLAVVAVAVSVASCESASVTKRIDYKSESRAPALEIPPDLSTPQYDDRYNVSTASGLAAQGSRPKAVEGIAVNSVADARIVRGGTERWLVVKTTPQEAWNTMRKFWMDVGFVLAVEQPTLGIMETDWAENRVNLPSTVLEGMIGKVADVFLNSYKRDKFRTRLEQGTEPGTVDIYISHRGAEQVPTTLIDNRSPAGFVWAVTPPDPGLEAEMLGRAMVRFGTSAPAATAAVQASTTTPGPERARLEREASGTFQLVVDDGFDRAWRRVGLALDRVGFTVVDRDRSKGTYFVRYADPDSDGAKKDKGFLDKLMFWKSDAPSVEQYRITVAEASPRSLVTVQDPNGAPDKSATGEKILSLLRDQLK